jgi:hypothetical protein
VGKTHLSIAIGIAAAKKRVSTYFIKCHDLINQLKKAHLENKLDQRIKHFSKYKLLIIDEIGYLPIGEQEDKMFFVKKFMFISTLIYIGMGWLVVIGWNQLVENLPFWGIFWLVLGGILYTFGTIFYVWRKMKYHHALWHVFVLAGSISHVFSVLFYVIPIFK